VPAQKKTIHLLHCNNQQHKLSVSKYSLSTVRRRKAGRQASRQATDDHLIPGWASALGREPEPEERASERARRDEAPLDSLSQQTHPIIIPVTRHHHRHTPHHHLLRHHHPPPLLHDSDLTSSSSPASLISAPPSPLHSRSDNLVNPTTRQRTPRDTAFVSSTRRILDTKPFYARDTQRIFT
jgi:hypothetical protein